MGWVAMAAAVAPTARKKAGAKNFILRDLKRVELVIRYDEERSDELLWVMVLVLGENSEAFIPLMLSCFVRLEFGNASGGYPWDHFSQNKT